MGKDISTLYTKERNQRCGRRGYHFYKHEKVTVISPADYGMFLASRGKWRKNIGGTDNAGKK